MPPCSTESNLNDLLEPYACEQDEQVPTYEDFIVSNYTIAEFVYSIDLTMKTDNNKIETSWRLFDQGFIHNRLINIKTFWSPEYGKCHTLKFKEAIRQTGISSIEIEKKRYNIKYFVFPINKLK